MVIGGVMETKKTEVMSLRVPVGTVKELKQLAHRRSQDGGKDVKWNVLVMELLQEKLLASKGG